MKEGKGGEGKRSKGPRSQRAGGGPAPSEARAAADALPQAAAPDGPAAPGGGWHRGHSGPGGPPTAQIHDQSYERYTGPRKEQSHRFWIVAKNVMVLGLRRWGVRIPAAIGFIVLIIGAVSLYAIRGSGYPSAPAFGPFGPDQRMPDLVIIQLSSALSWLGMIIGGVIGCPTVADDLRVGAFQFYFSRSIRATDYVLGKILGVFVLVGLPLLCVPVAIGLVSLALCQDADQLAKVWDVLPRALLFGVVGTAVFTFSSVGLGAAFASKRAAQATFVAYFIVVGSVAKAVGRATDVRQIELLALDSDWLGVGRFLFGVDDPPHTPPAWQGSLAALALCALGYFAIDRRVRGSEVSSVGGGS